MKTMIRDGLLRRVETGRYVVALGALHADLGEASL
jgi:hypothetical protein